MQGKSFIVDDVKKVSQALPARAGEILIFPVYAFPAYAGVGGYSVYFL